MPSPITAHLALLFSDPAAQDPNAPRARLSLLGSVVLMDGDPMPDLYGNVPCVGVTVASEIGATQAFARAAVLNRVLLAPQTAWMREFLPTQ